MATDVCTGKDRGHAITDGHEQTSRCNGDQSPVLLRLVILFTYTNVLMQQYNKIYNLV